MLNDAILTLKQRIVSLEDISGGGGDVIKDLVDRVTAIEEALADLGDIGSVVERLTALETQMNEVAKYAKPVKLELTGDVTGEADIVTGNDTALECSLGNVNSLTLKGATAKDLATITIDPKSGPSIKYKSKTSKLGQQPAAS